MAGTVDNKPLAHNIFLPLIGYLYYPILEAMHQSVDIESAVPI
jgi:hypothetical protein